MSEKGIIREYLVVEKHLDPFAAETFVKKFLKHDDILKEFLTVIETGKIPENGVKSGDWDAKALSEKLPHLEVQNVYEFLVGLRDDPENYLVYIAEGAPIL
jgi:hypothetical protein